MAAGNQAYIARYVARLKVLINKTQLIVYSFAYAVPGTQSEF